MSRIDEACVGAYITAIYNSFEPCNGTFTDLYSLVIYSSSEGMQR